MLIDPIIFGNKTPEPSVGRFIVLGEICSFCGSQRTLICGHSIDFKKRFESHQIVLYRLTRINTEEFSHFMPNDSGRWHIGHLDSDTRPFIPIFLKTDNTGMVNL